MLLGVASLGFFGYSTSTTSKPLTWQFGLLLGTWLVSTATVWHFLRHLPQGGLDFDGENWYFEDKVDQIEQVGTVSIRFDVQSGMLLRFESEFKQVSWLWLEERFALQHSSQDWHDLRRAVYSRPALQNSPPLI